METGNVREAEARNEREGTTLVLGGTGKTGRRVAERLEARGLPVRVGSRSGEPPFDWDDQTTWAPALEGVGAAYVTYFPDLAIPGAVEAVRSFAGLAVEAGVGRLVLLSGRGEEEAQSAEQVVREAGTEWTIVRSAGRRRGAVPRDPCGCDRRALPGAPDALRRGPFGHGDRGGRRRLPGRRQRQAAGPDGLLREPGGHDGRPRARGPRRRPCSPEPRLGHIRALPGRHRVANDDRLRAVLACGPEQVPEEGASR